MADGPSDLAGRCARGEPDAFREVVDLYGRAVEATLVHILGPRRDLEDLVQMVFLELARAVRRFRRESSFGTFLMGIAANVARRTLERGPKPTAPLDVESMVSGDDPEARAAAREALERMFAGLDRLSPKKRVAFVLHAIEGHDVAEVARMVGAKVTTVRMRISAARLELETLAEVKKP